MMKRICVSIVAALCFGTAEAASRISFERTLPAPQSLGTASDLAVVYAIGDNDKINTFVDTFVDQTNRSGTLRVLDATKEGRGLTNGRIDERAARRLRRKYPVSLFARVAAFTCDTTTHSGEVGGYDENGKRIRLKQQWVDAVCEAKVEVISAESFERVTAFRVAAEGTSPRESVITDDISAIAVDQAARYAGVKAAEQITPRRIRETVELMEDAPRFEEGMAMINASRPDEARRIWESASTREPGSAPLRLNLAAACEAVGDIDAARRNYEAAAKLAPDDRRFRAELAMFRRRNGLLTARK